MHYDVPAGTNLKSVCTDFPNLALLVNSATPGNTQIISGHTSIGK